MTHSKEQAWPGRLGNKDCKKCQGFGYTQSEVRHDSGRGPAYASLCECVNITLTSPKVEEDSVPAEWQRMADEAATRFVEHVENTPLPPETVSALAAIEPDTFALREALSNLVRLDADRAAWHELQMPITAEWHRAWGNAVKIAAELVGE